MALKIGLGFLAVLALLIVYASMQSPDYRISREITIQASADKIFPYLSNSRLAQEWGPWSDIDPDAKMVLVGPESGVGSRTQWDGGKQLGTGSATIISIVPNQTVNIRLEYVKPMEMIQDSEYSIRIIGPEQSVVTWSVRGQNNLMGRFMCIFMNMDKRVGGMFEQGLAKLKALAEK